MKGVQVALFVGICAVLAGPARGQQSVDVASVGGRVVDPTGAVVPGAQVTARHLETNALTESW
jgi:hypothetical protein